MTAQVVDPFVSFNYLVEIDGIARGAFQEVTGLDSTIDVIEHREGGGNTSPHKLAGQTKHANIVLKYGMTIDTQLFQWHKTVVDGAVDRRNGSVVLLDRRGSEVARWNFVRAWPSKYTAPSLNAEASDVAIETVELVHEGLERVS
ncbi:phage tail protein [Nocardioides sp. Root122]|uniref:phage tail protein n=1 Tax=Nocardioides TaxID=1839 RepID=UPI0007033ACD|nr:MULTISPECIES: phage tail protein [Nocardioides]KQV73505.1 phage tail protein [Nocardioides sp. Root122]MCK9825232.1 phage tail protein [Nocardioides cavernae]